MDVCCFIGVDCFPFQAVDFGNLGAGPFAGDEAGLLLGALPVPLALGDPAIDCRRRSDLVFSSFCDDTSLNNSSGKSSRLRRKGA